MTQEDLAAVRSLLSQELDKRFPPPLSLQAFAGYELIVLVPRPGAEYVKLVAEACAAASLRGCEVRFKRDGKWYRVRPGWADLEEMDVEDCRCSGW